MTDNRTTTAADQPGVIDAPEKEEPRFRVADYAVLIKPRIMTLVVFTAWVGMAMAPGSIAPETVIAAMLCVAIGAAASGAINMWYDRDIDQHMRRTRKRPLPSGRIAPERALQLGIIMGVGSTIMMAVSVNLIAAVLLAFTILFYVFIYTVWLKRRTPQNIVIGGAAGAIPPMIGWAATTGDIGLGSVVLFLIIFLWTPPHSWALALMSRGDYANAGVPMMPVVAGEPATKRQMLFYTVLMIAATLAPTFIGMSGLFYLVAAAILGFEFWRRTWAVWRADFDATPAISKSLFLYSILYLFLVFVALLADRVVMALLG